MKQWLAATDPPPPVWLLNKLLRDVLRALRHVHAVLVGGEPVVHRDIKPGNILVDTERGDRGVLADFDIARASSGTTTLAMAKGTEPYIAPEVADWGNGRASPASDMFAFGLTMVATLLPELFAARVPQTTAKMMQLFRSGGEGALAAKIFASAVAGGGIDFKVVLHQFYQRFNPAKIGTVDATLAKYRGHEAQLFASGIL